jgi:hypothetical protein
MPLTEIEPSDTNAVFAEIKRSYGQQRFWTVGDLSYTPPGETCRNPASTSACWGGGPPNMRYNSKLPKGY